MEDSTSKEVQAPAQERTTGNTASNFQNQIRNRVEINRRQREENALTKQIECAASEAERKRRENWEANFPFTPQYHPTLTFDPSLYDPNDPSTFNTDPELELAVKRHHPTVTHHPDGRIGVFGYNLDAQKSLLPGDPLLTPFPIEK